MTIHSRLIMAAILGLFLVSPALAEDDDDSDLAQQLTNPVADIISVPFQGNWN